MPLELITSNQVIFWPSVLSAALSCDVDCSDARRRSHIRGPPPPSPFSGKLLSRCWDSRHLNGSFKTKLALAAAGMCVTESSAVQDEGRHTSPPLN